MIDEFRKYFSYVNGELLWKKAKGSRGQIGKRFGSLEPSGYRHGMFNKKMYREHQIIFALHYGVIPEYIDHIDGNRSNNQLSNLRSVTQKQNGMNAKLRIDNKTGHKGILFDSNRNKFRVEIVANKKKHYVGRYNTLEEAVNNMTAARTALHGEYTNFGK